MDPKLADEAVEHLRALIRFDTTNPPGNEAPAAGYVAEALAKEGLEARLVESAPGRASVVARLPATAPVAGAGLLLHSHLDVVPADRARWRCDPFGAEIADGCVWGRGAVDCKVVTALSLAVLAHLKREKRPLARDVVLAAFADEEAGSGLGARFVVEKEPALLRGVEWALGEVGGFTLHLGGRRFYPVMCAERGVAWLKLAAEGKPGHGSLPHDGSAVLRLSRAVGRLRARALPIHATEPARAFLEALAHALGGTWGSFLRLLPTRWLGDRLLAALPESKSRSLSAILRNTATPTVLRAGAKENVIPSRAEAILDGRTLPGFTTTDLIAEIRSALGPEAEGLSIEVLREAPANVVPRDTALFDTIAAVVRERDPGAVAVPYMIPGFTDAQPLAALGIKGYGFAPLRLPEDLPFADLFHGDDERAPVEGIRFGVETLVDVVERFCVRR